MVFRQENKFDRFFNHRQSLIDQYTKGDLTKDEFIEENYYFIRSMNTKPFRRVDNIKKGIFNYQYYNVMAKYWQKIAHGYKKDSIRRQDFIEKTNYYYSKKDQVTLRILEILDFSGFDAYYVKVKSPNLKNKLIEIVLKDYEDLILHTKNKDIINRLIEENVLIDEKRKSLVDSYINNKY